MPYKAPKLCSQGGCPALLPIGTKYCSVHAHKLKSDYPRKHPEYNKLYTSTRWRAYRRMFLAEHPLCVNYHECKTAATVLDHIVDHDGDYERFWKPDNHQAMCSTCHNKKTGLSGKSWGKEVEDTRPDGRYY